MSACDEPASEQKQAATVAPEAPVFTAAGRSWIDINDKISPAVWLASREAGHDVPPNDAAAQSLRGLLSDADQRYTEGPRMIANRAVQIQAMLAERGVKETPREVIEGLVSLADVGERAGFGETGGHYVNARVASATRTAALESLRGQPLPKSSGSEER